MRLNSTKVVSRSPASAALGFSLIDVSLRNTGDSSSQRGEMKISDGNNKNILLLIAFSEI